MKILIVDDEPLVRKSLSRACRARKHDVVEAADGTEGLSKWRAEKPDLVFLDVLMPGLSGPELLREIEKDPVLNAKSERTKVILMSAYSGEHNVVTGADRFIAKPFEDVFAVIAEGEALATP